MIKKWISWFSHQVTYPDGFIQCKKRERKFSRLGTFKNIDMFATVLDVKPKLSLYCFKIEQAHLVAQGATTYLKRTAQLYLRWAQIANPQILGLSPQSQIRKFLRYASLQIANLQIFND
jgi:hypothetical protein